MDLLFYILLIPFIYLNYKILFTDIKIKKIPNKYLGGLLLIIPLYYLILFFNGTDVNIYSFIFQIILTFFVTFLLYFFGIWSAGDAKYLLTLALFIPYIGVIPFIGNISIITLIYLILYFIYFYICKTFIYKDFGTSLIANIKHDLSDKCKYYFSNSAGIIANKLNIFTKVVKWIVFFLVLFVSLRLFRIYMIGYIFSDNTNLHNLGYFTDIIGVLQDNPIYAVFGVILFFLCILYLIKWLYIRFRQYIILKVKEKVSNYLHIQEENVDLLFLLFVFIGLIYFIYTEYQINPYEITRSLKLIFTYYIILWVISKIIIYLYKITFQVSEQKIIDIKKLKKGDILDMSFIIKNFSTEVCLGASGNKDGILYPNPLKAIKEIENPVTKDGIQLLKKMYKITNNFHKKENIKNYEPLTTIKVLKTFAFSGYIFIGFILTYLYQDEIFNYILNIIIETIKNLYN